jgi:hypothetical protein
VRPVVGNLISQYSKADDSFTSLPCRPTKTVLGVSKGLRGDDRPNAVAGLLGIVATNWSLLTYRVHFNLQGGLRSPVS